MKYSFIVPVYNVEKYVKECLDSIISQYKFKELCELIIVDDGSTDNCPSIVDSYKSDNVKVIHQQNKGLGGARNTGIVNSTGDYIIFVDSDDIISFDFIEYIEKIDLSKYDLIRYNHVKFDNELPKDSNMFYQEIEVADKEELIYDLDTAWSFVYNRHIFDDLKFPDRLTHEDFAVVPYIILKYKKILLSQKVLYYYRNNPTGIMNTLTVDKVMELIESYKWLKSYCDRDNIEIRRSFRTTILNILRCRLVYLQADKFHERMDYARKVLELK